MSTLLKEVIQLMLERENDDKFQRLAKNSFVAVTNFLKRVESSTPQELEHLVGKDASGRFAWINLGVVAPRPEHEGLYLFFSDRADAGVKPTLTAVAQRSGQLPTREYRIVIYVNSTSISARGWNKQFAANVASWFAHARMSYIHEFTHVLDFRRMSDEYLASRTSRKRQAREKGQTKDFARYMNDPLESNAFTQESFAVVNSELRHVKTLDEFEQKMGATPAQFVDIFMTKYLDKRARKHWSDENKRKVIKRAIEFYHRARNRFE